MAKGGTELVTNKLLWILESNLTRIQKEHNGYMDEHDLKMVSELISCLQRIYDVARLEFILKESYQPLPRSEFGNQMIIK